MGKKLDLDPKDAKALLYFHKAAREGLGRERLGVRGWLLREEVERAVGLRVPERLSWLARRQLLDRDDVRSPHLVRPVWVYRIAQAGVAALEEYFSRSFEKPVTPGARSEADAWYYIPPPAAAALEQLVAARREGRGCALLGGEIGWMTLREIQKRIWPLIHGESTGWSDTPKPRPWETRGEDWKGGDDEDDDDDDEMGPSWDVLRGELPADPTPVCPLERMPYGDDLEWLIAAGLVQRWTVTGPGRRAVVVFRAVGSNKI